MRRAVVAALLALTAAGSALADTWVPIVSGSEIRFGVRAMGVQQTGRFRDWDASIEFEPDQPETANVSLTIDSASLRMDNGALQGMATGRDFLDTGRYPSIVFRLTSLSQINERRYQAVADVTVKGHTRSVRFPVDLRITGDTAQMTGGFSLRRSDFGIGTTGPWNALAGRDIRVDVSLNARRAP